MSNAKNPRVDSESLNPCFYVGDLLDLFFGRELQEVSHPDKSGVLFPVLSDSRLTGQLDR